MLVTFYKIVEVHFRLLGTNGFHLKAENERFTAAGPRCRQNLKNRKQRGRQLQRQGKRHLEINTCSIVAICDCPIFKLFAFYIVGKVRCNWIGVCGVKLNTEN